MQATPETLFQKVWNQHEIRVFPDGVSLLHVDRHLIHDLEAAPGLSRLAGNRQRVARPDLTFASPDHAVASMPGRRTDTNPTGGRLLRDMRRLTAAAGVRLFDIGDPAQGILHVVGPEQGITLPGALIVCGDSHTCTHGGLGALAFGIGSSEVAHVLATQTLRQRRPKVMRLVFDGRLAGRVTAKDLILHAIGALGSDAGRGYALEFAGSAVAALSIEERLTLCNLSIEMGAKIGMVAPDDTAFAYLHGRPFAPRGALFDLAVVQWRKLASNDDAVFDKEHVLDASTIAPQITWGINPEHVVPVTEAVPFPKDSDSAQRRNAMAAAYDYMGVQPGQPMQGLAVDYVFIGSCANSRITDLREAASVVRGRRVAAAVQAWVVPGSEATKRQAEAEGLDRIFTDAGFEWREASCSMCLAANGDTVAPGKRCISTSNRNFVGRQGPGARTHLASPAMAAAAAVAGCITDVRKMA